MDDNEIKGFIDDKVRNLHENNRGKFQMTSGSVQGVQEREQDIWKKCANN